MKFYRCLLTMEDYLFYATTERGKVAETGPFVHNYALTYALSYLWPDKGKLPPRYHKQQKPNYKEELSSVDFYITPAKLISGQQKVIQYNSRGESYHTSRGKNLGYPNWGYIKPFLPGSKFKFYIKAENKLNFPRYIRLGKFMGKARLEIEEPKNQKKKQGEFTANLLLNWEDLRLKPEIFDILPGTLPTQLIENGHYVESNYWQLEFEYENKKLPEGMNYLCSR